MAKLSRTSVGVIATRAMVIAVGVWLNRQVSIDRCLDRGGALNYPTTVCSRGSQVMQSSPLGEGR